MLAQFTHFFSRRPSAAARVATFCFAAGGPTAELPTAVQARDCVVMVLLAPGCGPRRPPFGRRGGGHPAADVNDREIPYEIDFQHRRVANVGGEQPPETAPSPRIRSSWPYGWLNTVRLLVG